MKSKNKNKNPQTKERLLLLAPIQECLKGGEGTRATFVFTKYKIQALWHHYAVTGGRPKITMQLLAAVQRGLSGWRKRTVPMQLALEFDTAASPPSSKANHRSILLAVKAAMKTKKKSPAACAPFPERCVNNHCGLWPSVLAMFWNNEKNHSWSWG